MYVGQLLSSDAFIVFNFQNQAKKMNCSGREIVHGAFDRNSSKEKQIILTACIPTGKQEV